MKKAKKLFVAINKVYKKLRDKYWRAKSRYIHYYEKLPLDEHAILLESEHGKKVSGNIFYIIKYLSSSSDYSEYVLYLSSLGRNRNRFSSFLVEHSIENVKIVTLASDEYIRLLASAKILINDTSFGPYYMKKEGQIYLNTWHGTPLKSMGRNDESGRESLGNVQKNLAFSDYLLMPNEYTKEHMVKDYMLENISAAKIIYSGYPRNEAFFNYEGRDIIREKEELEQKRVYAYLPTYRDGANKEKAAAYLVYFLYELDKRLNDDEVLYVNLHPLTSSKIKFKQFRHIRMIPKNYETYEFLNCCEVLITDYSSVMFDYCLTRKKIVLFPYDELEYLADRGLYLSIQDLPFPIVYTVESLLDEIRSVKQYEDASFLETFCPYDSPVASCVLCDTIILGKDHNLEVSTIRDNTRQNVFIYAGNLAANGITTSLLSLLNAIDLSKRNYYVTFHTGKIVKTAKGALSQLPEGVSYYATTGDVNLTVIDRIIRKMFKHKILSASMYMKILGKRVYQGFLRNYGGLRIDKMIQFNGYEQEIILEYSTFPYEKTIFVHSDMVREIETKETQRRDVLGYAYRNYTKVAVVTKDIVESTSSISHRHDNIVLAKNVIDHMSITNKASVDIDPDEITSCFPDVDYLYKVLEGPTKKFISVGRFSPEKGHERLVNAFHKYTMVKPNSTLIIMGGYSYEKRYERLIELVQKLGLDEKIVLLLNVSNPYPIIKACDYFILSSYYEGFGLVLAEADILGLPVVSTDIVGPRSFLKEHNGTMVDNSEDGLYRGFCLLGEDKIPTMNIDYDAYNRVAVDEFEQLLS